MKNNETIKNILSRNYINTITEEISDLELDIKESNDLFEKITNFDEKNIIMSTDDTNNMIERLINRINYVDEIINTDDKISYSSESTLQDLHEKKLKIIRLRSIIDMNYRKISYVYYKQLIYNLKEENGLLTKKIEELKQSSDEISKEVEDAKENTNRSTEIINKKVEGLGATFLSIIVTYSLISSMLAVVLRINVVYIPLLFSGTLWLMLTTIIFVGSLFKTYNNDSLKDLSFKTIILMYIFVSLATLFIYFKTEKYLNKSVEDKKIIEECIESKNYENIEELEK